MSKHRLKSKPHGPSALTSVVTSCDLQISVAEAAKKVQYISVWTLVHTDGTAGVQEELNMLHTAGLLRCSLAKRPGATEAATWMENTQVQGWGCKHLRLNLVLSCMSHVWKDQSGKKKKTKRKESIWKKKCQHQVNGVCDVPTKKLVNNPAIIQRQINRYLVKLSQMFLNLKTYSRSAPCGKIPVALWHKKTHQDLPFIHVWL